MRLKKISLIFETRPEAIKIYPLILAMKQHPDFTGQHREMLDQVLGVFEVIPDVDLNVMQPDQTLAGLTARAMAATDAYIST